jgi:hypothetical protein
METGLLTDLLLLLLTTLSRSMTHLWFILTSLTLKLEFWSPTKATWYSSLLHVSSLPLIVPSVFSSSLSFSPSLLLDCGYCKGILPLVREVATTLGSQIQVSVFKLSNTFSWNSIQVPGIPRFDSIPTIFFYPSKHQEKAILFEGKRTVEGMLEFVHSNLKDT